MSRLLGLPRELRDLIVSYVLQPRQTAPVDHKDTTIPRKAVHIMRYMKSVGLKPLMFEDDDFEPAAKSLLLTNWQLHNEVEEALNQSPGKGKKYAMDLMFVEERDIWPTWTNVPTFTRNIETLEVDVRIVGAMTSFDAGYGSRSTIWTPGNGAPPAVVWAFYALLKHVMTVGASNSTPTPTNSTYDSDVTALVDRIAVKHLVLCFSTSAEETELADVDQKHAWFRARYVWAGDHMPQELQGRIMRPEWFADFLGEYMEGLLGMAYSMAQYGAFLYDCIDKITIKGPKGVHTSFDLGQKLASLELNRNFPSDQRNEIYQAWKARTLALRATKGLLTG